MPAVKGSNTRLVLDFETTYGQDPGTVAGKIMPFNSFGLRGTRNQIEPKTITNKRDPVMPIQGNTDVSGDIVVPIDVTNIGFWLKLLLGQPVKTGTGPYTHTFTVKSTLPSVVLEMGFLDIPYYAKYNGVKVDSMSITFGGDNELTARIGLIGAKETLSSSPYDSNPTLITFTRLNNNQLTVKEGGTTSAIISEMTLEIRNNLDKDYFTIASGGFRGALPEGLVEVRGNIKAIFDSITLYNKAVNSTETSLEIEATSGTNSLKFVLPEIKFKRNGIPVETPNGVWLNLDYSAYYEDNADNTAVKVVLTNNYSAGY